MPLNIYKQQMLSGIYCLFVQHKSCLNENKESESSVGNVRTVPLRWNQRKIIKTLTQDNSKSLTNKQYISTEIFN